MEINDGNNYFVFQSTFMEDKKMEAPIDTLKEIRSMMERSARFLSLSGWSGIWAGCIALIGAGIAHSYLKSFNMVEYYTSRDRDYFSYQITL